MIDIVEESLTGVAEGCMAQVVAQTNRFDQIAVETQGATDITCDARNKLHVQAATRQIIVAAKAENLSFAGVSGVRRQMENLFGIAHKGRTHERALVCGSINTADDLTIVASIRVNDTRGTVGSDTLDQLGRQRRGNAIHTRLDGGCLLIDCHGMLLKKGAQRLQRTTHDLDYGKYRH